MTKESKTSLSPAEQFVIEFQRDIKDSTYWDDLPEEDKENIDSLFYLAKVEAQGLGTSMNGSEFAMTMFTLGAKVGHWAMAHPALLSYENRLAPLKGRNEKWNRLKKKIGERLAPIASKYWEEEPDLKLTQVCKILAQEAVPILIEAYRESAKAKSDLKAILPVLDQRCPNGTLSPETIKEILNAEDKINSFIPQSARKSGRPQSS